MTTNLRLPLIFIIIFIIIIFIAIIICCCCNDKINKFNNVKGLVILPISFAIPECMFMDPQVDKKVRKFSAMIPGRMETYIYHTEDKYYKQYNESKFGITKSKSGHDCLRHYEIIAAGAIPYYKDIDKIPPTTMHNFPREIIKNAMEGEDDDLVYRKCLDELQTYSRKHLTTRALGKYFLEKINADKNSRIIMISQPHEIVHTDYQRDCLAIGLIEEMGSGIDFYEDLYWLFNDYKNCKNNYGKGFSLCGKLDSKGRNITNKADAVKNLKENVYDTIIVTTSSNMTKLDRDIINLLSDCKPALMSSVKMVLIIGNDGYHHSHNNVKKLYKE